MYSAIACHFGFDLVVILGAVSVVVDQGGEIRHGAWVRFQSNRACKKNNILSHRMSWRAPAHLPPNLNLFIFPRYIITRFSKKRSAKKTNFEDWKSGSLTKQVKVSLVASAGTMPFTVRHTLHMHKSYYIPYTFWLKDLLQQSHAHHHHHHHELRVRCLRGRDEPLQMHRPFVHQPKVRRKDQ